MKITRLIPTKIVAIFIVMMTISCASKKDIVYFQDALNYETIVNEDVFVTKFKVDDLIGIFVSGKTPEAGRPFNLYRGAQEGGIAAEQVDYLVDLDGMIDFPILGRIKVAGLSPNELRNELREKLTVYIKDPIINIRLKNFEVTINGEVNRPGTYKVNGERINIMEALGLAGDLKIKGRRDNILVMRDFNGVRNYMRIDLTSKNAVNSPAYYLTQNDVVYVEPNKSAINSSNQDSRAGIIVSIASVLITSTVLLITRN
ncbi:polysaccharide biosynthesis/export family protein [Cellulophaga lytica]|uniref:Polysaccharide export protein n=1 Tax=Cellulophaga lytica (strain ATCC 23178 / DSM 7489 / JCM 8516 / NBRC 14961 / NCIMB 1423 / VKM B-1433 / Cy l20) TaxID=867900 RepID=F0R9W5_CELLC|nr:polysaccharide biosynthesis/export family protein [Cellulophaga lytica]ADY30460.1 polysaccharide export protein [Cellulophaga lytica DSM 7489]WQG78609.1 polysaccharide biosynthesis/export family protein [Cellulophaga lytica]SNQ44101.1 Polysaccharide export protein [Cellulophaga lytica]